MAHRLLVVGQTPQRSQRVAVFGGQPVGRPTDVHACDCHFLDREGGPHGNLKKPCKSGFWAEANSLACSPSRAIRSACNSASSNRPPSARRRRSPTTSGASTRTTRPCTTFARA